MDIALRFTMSSIIYIHHEGQFKSPDGDTKVRAEAGKMLFLDTRHDVYTYSHVVAVLELKGPSFFGT